jgi:hypothetical protein
VPRADARVAFFSNPYINPAYSVNPAFATSGIPDRSETFEPAAAEDFGELEAHRRLRAVSPPTATVPQRRLQLVGQRGHRETYYGACSVTRGRRPVSRCGPAPYTLTEVHDTFKKEVSKAAELGFKSYFLDRSLS